MSGSRELPVPNVNHFTSLNQAHATLQHCWAKLMRYDPDLAKDLSPTSQATFYSQPSYAVHDKQFFQSWLERWEAAFTAFLANAMASMTNVDITESRILKTNHLACTVLAAEDDSPSDVFESEFLAIIELAGAVVRSRHLADSPLEAKSPKRTLPVTAGLDVWDPLHVVLVRCNRDALRNRASDLLQRAYQAGKRVDK